MYLYDVIIVTVGCNSRSTYIQLLLYDEKSKSSKTHPPFRSKYFIIRYSFCARTPINKTNAIRKLPYFRSFDETKKRNSCASTSLGITNTLNYIIILYSYNLVCYFFPIELNSGYKLTAKTCDFSFLIIHFFSNAKI